MLTMKATNTIVTGSEIGHPHSHRVVAIECLLYERRQEAGPDEDEGCGDGANHGEAEKRIEELEELAAKALRHVQRDKEWVQRER